MRSKLLSILTRILLLPIMPCFMWGPVTHPYIAYEAYRKVKENPRLASNPEIMTAIDHHKETYIYAANSPDAIATNHVLFNIIIYDYAHNNMPNEPKGNPMFGYRLVAKALERLKRAPRNDRSKYEKELAFACGWLTHQVSDWIAHYKEVKRPIGPGLTDNFYGYANSHQVLSPYFHEDILTAKREIEHALTETLHDAHIMFSDRTGLFGPGQVRVELPTEEKDNLISIVSETFGEFGCSKIPSGHLPKLKEDFDIVINGIQSGVVFAKAMQPGLEQIAREFAESNRIYIDESIDRVVDKVLSLTEEEIIEESNKMPPNRDSVRATSVVSAKPESLIHRLAFSLGKTVTPVIVDTVFGSPVVTLKWDLPVLGDKRDPKIQIHLGDRVRKLLPGLITRFGGRSESVRALVNFAAKLLSSSDEILKQARDAYCTGLRPVTSLDVTRDPFEPEDDDSVLIRMINEGIVRIRFTPAKRTDKDSTQYLLDPDTAVIRINGYQLGEQSAPFTAERRWDETGEILKYEIRLNQARLGNCVHLFADIKDKRGEHSQYIDKQIKLG
ncbi:MAG: zinc dependent phospholipase C family protein [Bacillota bacterium]|jgi:hypothetical protein